MHFQLDDPRIGRIPDWVVEVIEFLEENHAAESMHVLPVCILLLWWQEDVFL